MQIKTIMRCHLTLVRMDIIKKARNNKCWRGCEEKGTLLHCWWECKLAQPLRRKVCGFLQNLGIELPYGPAIPLLAIYPATAAAKSLQSCPTLCDPMDCSLPDSSIHGIFQARALEWGAIERRHRYGQKAREKMLNITNNLKY